MNKRKCRAFLALCISTRTNRKKKYVLVQVVFDIYSSLPVVSRASLLLTGVSSSIVFIKLQIAAANSKK